MWTERREGATTGVMTVASWEVATMVDGWDLREAATQAIALRDERDWKQFHAPKNLAAGLAIEAAELQELFLWSDGLPAEAVASDADLMTRIREELADVVIYAITIAHDLDVDMAEAIRQKLDANARRYPVERYRGSAEKAPHEPYR